VVLSKIFPAGAGFKQTIEGRRKRFRQALIGLLEKCGWRHEGRCVFSKSGGTVDGFTQSVSVKEHGIRALAAD
jgi:hypothetical protein